MIQLEEKFDGHIILYCKGHYNLSDVDFILGLQRIWAVRCGLSIDQTHNSFKEYIADHLHEIFAKCVPSKLPYFHQILNRGLCDEWQYEGLSGIERVIMVYRNELMQLQIRETTEDTNCLCKTRGSRFFKEGWFCNIYIVTPIEKAVFLGVYDNVKAVNNAIKELKIFINKNI